MFGIHWMGFDRRATQRSKRPWPDMESDRLNLDAFFLQSMEQGSREMEAGGRSRHRALMLGVYGLIAPPIAQGGIAGRGVVIVGALDIGWEGDTSGTLQPGAKVTPAAKFDLPRP